MQKAPKLSVPAAPILMQITIHRSPAGRRAKQLTLFDFGLRSVICENARVCNGQASANLDDGVDLNCFGASLSLLRLSIAAAQLPTAGEQMRGIF